MTTTYKPGQEVRIIGGEDKHWLKIGEIVELIERDASRDHITKYRPSMDTWRVKSFGYYDWLYIDECDFQPLLKNESNKSTNIYDLISGINLKIDKILEAISKPQEENECRCKRKKSPMTTTYKPGDKVMIKRHKREKCGKDCRIFVPSREKNIGKTVTIRAADIEGNAYDFDESGNEVSFPAPPIDFYPF